MGHRNPTNKGIATAHVAALVCGAIFLTPQALRSQTIVDSYTAVIAPEDRRNSSGGAVTDIGAIIAQDRANYHRFGIRQSGDGADMLFGSRARRAEIPQMVARGEVSPDARAAIEGGGATLVNVQILQNGNTRWLNVDLAGQAQASDAPAPQPEAPVLGAGQSAGLPTLITPSPDQAQWRVTPDPSELRGVAEVQTASKARVVLECTRQGADPSRYGGPGALLPYQAETLNLLVARSAFSGLPPLPAGQAASVAVSVDSAAAGSTAMGVMADRDALGTAIPMNHPFVTRLGSASTLTLQEMATGATADIPLGGFVQAMQTLRAVCALPAGQPSQTQPQAPGFGAALLTPTLGAAKIEQAPAPTAPEPTDPVLAGNDAVAQKVALWLVGQRPGLVASSPSIYEIGRSELPPGYPRFDASQTRDRTYVPRLGQAIAARAAQETLPATVELDLPVAISRQSSALPFSLNFASIQGPLTNHELQPSRPAAIRTVHLGLPFRTGQLFLRATQPFTVKLPSEMRSLSVTDHNGQPALRAFGADEVLLRTTMAITDPRVLLPIRSGRGLPNRPAVEASATVLRADLIRRARAARGVTPVETVLATWTKPDATAPAAAPAAFAERFAETTEDGRLAIASFNHREARGLPPISAATGRDLTSERRAALKLIQTAAILAKNPERPLAQSVLIDLLFTVVPPTARDSMAPAGFQQTPRASNMNEVAFAQALKAAEPQLRAYITAAAPPLPLAVRYRSLAMLGEYDLNSQSIAVHFPGGDVSFLPDDGLRQALRKLRGAIPDAVSLSPDQANRLIQALEVDTIPSRQVPLRFDYRVESVTARRGGGPITLSEIEAVTLSYRLEEVTLFADMAESATLLSRPFAQAAPPDGTARLPEAIFDTTPASIWATYAKETGNNEDIADFVSRTAAFREAARAMSKSQRATLLKSEVARISAEAMDEFWVGLSLTPGNYNAQEQMLEVRLNGVTPIPHDRVSTADALPSIGFARDSKLEKLPMTPDQYAELQELIGNKRFVYALALVRPFDDQLGGSYTLLVNRPSLLLVGAPQNSRMPDRVALRLKLPEDAGLALAPQATDAVTQPEQLLLDGEGLDLLAIAQVSGIYGPAAYKRMLVERLALERRAAQTGQAAPWGTFFADPSETLRPSIIDALLPAFTAWTQARANALPDRLTVPFGNHNGRHSVTTCRAARRLPDNGIETRAVVANLRALVPDFTAPQTRQQLSGQIAQSGPRDVVVLTGRATHPNGNCEHLNLTSSRSDLTPQATGLDYANAGYVDAIAVSEFPIVPGSNDLVSIDYVFDRADVRFAQLSPTSADQPGLRGVLVIDGDVARAIATVTDNATRTTRQLAPVEADEWLSLLQPDNAATRDILGLSLGAPLSEVAKVASERIEGAIRFNSVPPAKRRVYGNATGFVAPDRSEVLLSIHDNSTDEKRAIAIMRHRAYAPGALTVEELRNALIQKYGEPVHVVGDSILWGVPPQEIDGYGVCGGARWLNGSNIPTMEPDLSETELQQLRNEGRYAHPEWNVYGWPVPYADNPEPFVTKARDYCRTAVLARVRAGNSQVYLTVWIVNSDAAEKAFTTSPEPGTADVDL